VARSLSFTLAPVKPKHHTRRGFRNNYAHDRHGLKSLLKFLWGWDRTGAKVDFPLAQGDPGFLAANRTRPTVTWIGHATFLVQIGGLNVLTDPHFTRRASPLDWAGPERVAPLGLSLRNLPAPDVVLISHNHYDHLDDASVRWLAKHHPKAVFVVPLGLRRWLQRRHVANVVELDWWQRHDGHDFGVTAVPVQHFSGRSHNDRNATLWCGFVLEAAQRKVLFAGDTGYSKDFADIRERLGAMDLALLPIGAYAPRWFMRAMHVNPAEAVRIHQDVGSRQSVAMHWGTFRLTEEPLDEPPKALAKALAAANIPPEQFWVLQHGETRTVDLLR
jgi:N-acyl-phosphatidylethanolamine-hydrolysing phospholipase D